MTEGEASGEINERKVTAAGQNTRQFQPRLVLIESLQHS